MFREIVKIASALVVIAVLSLCVVIPIASLVESHGCQTRWGARAEWNFLGGCMVNTRHGWVPEMNVRATDLVVEED